MAKKYEPVNCQHCGVKIGILPDNVDDEDLRQKYRDALRRTHRGKCSEQNKPPRETFHIGITASRRGLSKLQIAEIVTRLRSQVASRGLDNLVLHQGCCVGGDEQVAVIAYALGIPIVAHPPKVKTYASQLAEELSTTVMLPATYAVCNRRIVDESNLVICAPTTIYASGTPDTWSSRTWNVYHYAESIGVEAILVRPDGVLQYA